MRVTEAPEALPGACFKCRSSNRDFFFDLEISIEFEGAIYICNECFFEMLSISPEIVGFKGEISELEDELNEARYIIGNYERALDGLFSTPAWSDLINVRSTNGKEPPAGGSKLKRLAPAGAGANERSVKPSDDQDVDGLPESNAEQFKLDL